MRCARVRRELSAWLDGASGRAAAVDAHLARCAGCRAVAHELRRVVAVARDLPRWDAPPALFERVTAAAAAAPARRRAGWLLVALPAATAAAVALAVWLRAPDGGPPPAKLAPTPATAAISAQDRALLAAAQREFERAEGHYRQAIGQLRRLALDNSASWPPGRRQAYQQEMAAIDDAVARFRHVARVAPADPAAQELLFAAYRRQLVAMQDAILGQPRGFAAAAGPETTAPAPVTVGHEIDE